MAYTPQQWHDDTTVSPYGPISGARLNYIEAGIEAAAAAADAAGTASGGASLGTALPVIDGAAAAGTSGSAAHEDHVHPTDTSRAALASPTFSGTPSLPTASVAVTQSAADSSTKLATTAFVTTADNLKANLAGPTFTGTVTLPSATIATTQTASDNSTKLSTTAYADAAAAARAPSSGIAESAVTNLVSDLAAKAPLASPTFTGTATIPNIAGPTTLAGTVTLPSTTVAVTPSASDNSTKPATTAYVDTADALKANLAGPTFTGSPTLPTGTTGVTQALSVNNTALATTAYVRTVTDSAVAVQIGPSAYATPAFPAMVSSSSAMAATNDYRWIRVTMPKTGTLHDVYCLVNTTGGTAKVGILDDGQANGTHTVRTILSLGTAAVGSGGAWQGYDPALAVTAGDTLVFFVTADGTSAKFASISGGSGSGLLPTSSFYAGSGASTTTQKLCGTILAANLTGTVNSTVTDANMATAAAAVLFVWRIT